MCSCSDAVVIKEPNMPVSKLPLTTRASYIKVAEEYGLGRNVTSDPEPFFSRDWNYGLTKTLDFLYCRVSFDLVSKSNNNKVYSFSKYFKVNPVKRNFYHENVNI